jgi:hypothetical protein
MIFSADSLVVIDAESPEDHIPPSPVAVSAVVPEIWAKTQVAARTFIM